MPGGSSHTLSLGQSLGAPNGRVLQHRTHRYFLDTCGSVAPGGSSGAMTRHHDGDILVQGQVDSPSPAIEHR